MSVVKKYLSRFINWSKYFLPIALVISFVKYLRNKVWKAERKVDLKELEIEKAQNEKNVNDKYRNTSDADIVRDAIREGRDLNKKD